ncbi:hypothetical protein MKK69_19430 [Methylobacterium sp. J-026]|uniref:hypothetical protein n=1 Tax=Methylobacterium sp. J-026 TaxID=2836624 RepID=UPI001FB96C62|nr:hypothetical protein [Methylobacterium sp. J-026]MCJ2136196.1 hypothetical protein [Methylobacterium sp. J-026]
MLVVDETQTDLAALIMADFRGLRAPTTPSRDLVDWLHYRARHVAERTRQVVRSNEVETHRGTYPAIDEIAHHLANGLDVSPRLSNSIRTKGSNPRADLMFNQWQVSHFHLGPWLDNPRRVERTGPVLFAHIAADRAILLDVQPHGSWTQTNLLRILLRIDPTTMHDIGPSGATTLTDTDHKTLRGKHSNATVDIGGRSYNPPGWAIMASGDSMRFRVLADYLEHLIGRTLHQIQANSLPPGLMQQLAGQIGVPVRLGVRFERGLLILYEKNRGLDLAAPNMVVA